MSQILKIFRKTQTATLPTKNHDNDACFDLFNTESPIRLIPGGIVKLDTQIAVVIPTGYDLDIKERSGLALQGLNIGGGIVDESYSGSLCVILRNISNLNSIVIEPFAKIAQMRLVKRIETNLIEINKEQFNAEHEQSQRKEKGFGSSG